MWFPPEKWKIQITQGDFFNTSVKSFTTTPINKEFLVGSLIGVSKHQGIKQVRPN